jgi:hypothetical protein
MGTGAMVITTVLTCLALTIATSLMALVMPSPYHVFTFDVTNTNAMDIITMLVAAGYNILYVMFDNKGIMTVIATHNNRYVHSCNALLEIVTPINLCKRNKLKHLLPSDVFKI